MLFKGSCVALVTPFHPDGSVNHAMLKTLVDWHIGNHTQALVILGTTGENPTLSETEKFDVFKTVVEHAKGRIVLIANTGDNNTQASIERSLIAKKLGYDGCLLVVPYYNKPQQRGLVAHFKAIADAVELPCILYNVPSRTGLNMTSDTLLELAKHPHIVGVKESSHDEVQIKSILKNAPTNFGVYCGNDDQNQEMLEWGAHGLISVSANLIPSPLQKQCEAVFSHHFKEARELHETYARLHADLFIESNPVAVKAGLNLMGFNVGACRLPLVDMEPEHAQLLEETLKQVHLTKVSL